MTDTLLEFCDTPVTDDPLGAALSFACGAIVACGGVLIGHHVLKESLRKKDNERECCR